MNISKVAHKLMMGYTSVYHVMKEYDWFIKHDIDPFSDIQHRKRLSKESMKEIQEFMLKSKNSFASKDLIVAVKEKTNKDVKDYEVRKYLKDELKMSYRKWTIKPWFVDTVKLSVLRSLFFIRISHLITPLALMISIDETTFNNKITSNKSWIGKKHFYELFNANFVGSWSLY